MYNIVYGKVLDQSEIEGLQESTNFYGLNQAGIDYVIKELPKLLSKGESLHITTHIDHDGYFVIEVLRNDWPKNKCCEVRVFVYNDGTVIDCRSYWISLDDQEEIQEFMNNLFKEK